MLSELKQRDVWEGWIGSEIRANYFADMAQHYQTQQKILTWMTLLLSSGAAATFITDWLPSDLQWVKPALALLTAGVSFCMLLQQNQKRVTECADLHFRWNKLASEYKSLWEEMYSDDAPVRLIEVEERESELSKSSLAIPNKSRTMLKWQNYVEQQHGLTSAA
ncbi:MAG TPA: hypothetical protein VGM18_10795 [Candidatus Sulfotelmatobacter sp.]|jgi:hypothetical protein